jgi:hypothetical protein
MARVALASLADARCRQIPAASLLGGDCMGTANVALLSVECTNATLVIEALLNRRCGLTGHFSPWRAQRLPRVWTGSCDRSRQDPRSQIIEQV